MSAAKGALDLQAASALSEADVVEVVQKHFGFAVSDQESLGGEVDQNVCVTDGDGRRYLLKISAAADTDIGIVRWHEQILSHLEVTAPEVPLPRLLPTTSGELYAVENSHRGDYFVRLMTWLPGTALADQTSHSDGLLTELGQIAGRLTKALSSMPEPDAQNTHDWDMLRARAVVDQGIDSITDTNNKADVEMVMAWYDTVEPLFADLPRGVAHQDLNDSNILATTDEAGLQRITGVLDINDSLFTIRVAELAVAAAYAIVRKDDPLHAVATVVAGFNSVTPLTDHELAVVFPLAAARLAMNATTWTQRLSQNSNDHGERRMKHTWPALAKVARIDPDYAEATLRHACGWAAHPDAVRLEMALGILDRTSPWASPADRTVIEVDTAVTSDLFDSVDWHDGPAVTSAIGTLLGDRTDSVGYLRHLSPNVMWSARRQVGAEEPATTTLGVHLLLRSGEFISAPLAGTVEPTESGLTVRHEIDDTEGRLTFRTHWQGITRSVGNGPTVEQGDLLGVADTDTGDGLGTVAEVTISLPRRHRPRASWPNRIRPSETPIFAELSPDPAQLLGITDTTSDRMHLSIADVLALRRKRLATSQRAYYTRPMNLQRGRGVWMYDENGYGYLDSLNNVTHVGHANPRVAAASNRQMHKLNTNSRFIYEGIATYADKLVSTLPAPLEVVFLVCSGSEANDLALRIAHQVTGRQDIAIIDGAYHGNTGVVTGISPNRYKGPGGAGAPSTTHETQIPDRYRGPWGYDDDRAGIKYGGEVARVISEMVDAGTPPAAFIAESLMGTAGNIVFPDGYLETAFAATRAAGGLTISDEVQVGVGRMGDKFWGFELGGVVPDIVTMGKPLGNGHPLAAVVTTREIADAFDTGMKYFNTFGGNPVSCAIGSTVLDIIAEDGLQQHAKDIGHYFHQQLLAVQGRHEIIGDVRAQGLYLGVELVRDRASKEPAKAEAFVVTELMKEQGVIVFPNGVYDNVLKIKPPMIFQPEHVDLYCEALDRVLDRIPV